MYLSEEIITETQRVLLDEARPHRRRYRYPNESVADFTEGLRDLAHLVSDLPRVTAVPRDPNDDPVVATALAAHAMHIITRDDDLLSLQEYEGITMMTPEAFMTMLRVQGRVE